VKRNATAAAARDVPAVAVCARCTNVRYLFVCD
jgi:hypothetical protein